MQESVMQRMWSSAHLSGGNAAYVEELYELYLHDPNSVSEEWRTYFQKLPAYWRKTRDELNQCLLVASALNMRKNKLRCFV